MPTVTNPNESAGATDQSFEPFIDKKEAGRRLGIKPRTLDDWLKNGRVPFYRINRSVRMRWSEVTAHLAETCRVHPSAGKK